MERGRILQVLSILLSFLPFLLHCTMLHCFLKSTHPGYLAYLVWLTFQDVGKHVHAKITHYLILYWLIHQQYATHPVAKRYMRRVRIPTLEKSRGHMRTQILRNRLFLEEFGIEREAYAGSDSGVHKTFWKLWSAPKPLWGGFLRVVSIITAPRR